jgi:hypothetical protein
MLNCFFAGSAQARGGRAPRARAAQEEVQSSRELDDDVWKKKRKPSKVRPRPRKYQRVGVAPSSASAQIQRAKPNAGNRKRKPAVTWQDVALDESEQVGVTIWRLRKCADDSPRCFLKLNDAQNRNFIYEALRVNTEADFQVGDGIQLAIESPITGFIYVIHQEVDAHGKPGDPKLLYPLQEGVNAVAPGRPLLIPTQGAEGEIKVLKMRNDKGKKLSAERLKIIITPKPIDGIFVQGTARPIVHADLTFWESKWSGRLELFDLNGGEKETMSPNEWYAMQRGNNGSRDLTTEDLGPQKLYVVERKKSDGVLITLNLPYGN